MVPVYIASLDMTPVLTWYLPTHGFCQEKTIYTLVILTKITAILLHSAYKTKQFQMALGQLGMTEPYTALNISEHFLKCS